MPLSSFLVVPAELNNYCSATMECSARAGANRKPQGFPWTGCFDTWGKGSSTG